MPSYSGIWTLSQQFQGRGQGVWPELPGAPTIGTATVGASNSALITFTAPAFMGVPATLTYTATSTPGCITGSGASSPVTVSGLTDGTSYTFKVKAQNGGGFSPCSAASNSITAINQNSQSYTIAGTYTWIAPACITSVSVVAVGGGGGGAGGGKYTGGGGGALTYRNNVSVTPGTGYPVVVGTAGVGGAFANVDGSAGGASTALSMVAGGGGGGTYSASTAGAPSGTYTAGFSGGVGPAGTGAGMGSGGGGAAGYAGNGGAGSTNSTGTAGSGGSGGGGGGGGSNYSVGCVTYYGQGGDGGGIGLFGQGANGAGGTGGSPGGPGGDGGAGSGGTGGKTPGGGGGGGNRSFCCFCFCSTYYSGRNAAVGAVRIMWPGTTRSFPSTNAGTP